MNNSNNEMKCRDNCERSSIDSIDTWEGTLKFLKRLYAELISQV